MKSRLVVFIGSLVLWSCCAVRASAEEPPPLDLRECENDLRQTQGKERVKSFAKAEGELEAADCERADVYCVEASGNPAPGEDLDPRLVSGQTFTVKLFGPKSCEGVLTVGTNVKLSTVRRFREVPPTTSRTKAGGDETGREVEIKFLAKSALEISATAESLTIVVARADGSASLNGIELPVTPPRYYLDAGLLVAFTPGYQQVSTSRSPGTTELFIREEVTIHPSAAVTLNYFFLGQLDVPRFSGWNGLGLQAGIGGDLNRLDDEFYLGAIWEPVPGAGISAGLSLLRMQELQPGYPSGALVTPGDVPKDESLHARLYFGVALNTEVFQTLLHLGEKAIVPN